MSGALVVRDLDYDAPVGPGFGWWRRHRPRRSIACRWDLVRVDRSQGRPIEVWRCRVCGATRLRGA